VNKNIIKGAVVILLALSIFVAIDIFWPRKVITLDQTNKTFLVKGDVRIKKAAPGSQWNEMTTSTILEKGDSIETSGEAFAELMIGDNVERSVRVGQRTNVVVEGINPTVINLSKGKVMAAMKKLDPRSSFVVKTPIAICGARGTAWLQEANGDASKICVFQNDVYIQCVDAKGRPIAKKYITSEGTQRAIEKGSPIGNPEKISPTTWRLWEAWYKSIMFLREGKILVDDFDTQDNFNYLDGAMGSWNMFYTDPTQSCKDEFTDVQRVGDTGYSLKLTYDVDSKTSAYNGFFTKLMNIDITGYKYLVFYIKADKAAGCTTRVNLELKNGFQIGRTTFEGITDEWKKVVIPVAKFVGLTELGNMKEFVVVFSDINVTKKEGVVYIDNIYFSKEEPPRR